MKKILYKILFLIIAILLVFASAYYYYYYIGRYKISAPMQDVEYKKSIIRDSENIHYKLENLRPVVGEEELIEFIKNNDNNPSIYTPSEENIKNGVFRANLHMHTTQSDGKATVQERLEKAQEYAEKNIKDGFMYIAITDHNTINGAKEAVEVLQNNPNKYKNVKVILGMEVYTAFKSKYSNDLIDIHVLNWCLNPYDKYLNKEFFKAIHANKWNRYKPDRDFDDLIFTMSNYAIPGVAHPIRYTSKLEDKKYLYMEEMLERYKKQSSKPCFTEVYYQVYPRYYSEDKVSNIIKPLNKYVNQKAVEKNIIRTGSTDSHSTDIFD